MKKNIYEYRMLLKKEGLWLDDHLKRHDISGISYRYQDVQKNDVFVCKGRGFKEQYLAYAHALGADVYLSENIYEIDMDFILVKDIYKALAILSKWFYALDEPLILYGVTGTKGKTTTVHFIYSIFQQSSSCGLISSLLWKVGNHQEEAVLTTPESRDLQRLIYYSKKQKDERMVVEVSSQALKYHRVYGCHFKAVVFLNIDIDHISPKEHENFNDYFISKLSLFRQSQLAIINKDSPFFDIVFKVASSLCQIVTFSISQEADVMAKDIVMDDRCASFLLQTASFKEYIHLNMSGLFNVENALAAIALALSQQVPMDTIKKGIAQCTIEGRMDFYESDDKHKKALVSYAHNPLSMERNFQWIKSLFPKADIFSIFGCPGGKAYSRRKSMGNIASSYSKKIYLIPDDPEEEMLSNIQRDIMQGISVPCECFDSRKEAIEKAFSEQEDVFLFVAGKGDEDYIQQQDRRYSIEKDGEVIQKCLKNYQEHTNKTTKTGI